MIVISIPTVSIHDSAGNRLFLGWNYRTKVHMNYAQLGGQGAVGRMLLHTRGSSGKSKVNKGTRIECQIILSFISNKDKRPSQPHQPLKESHAKPPWDMGLGVGGDLSDFQNVKLCSVSSS